MPSICSSPSPTTPPSIVIPSLIREATFGRALGCSGARGAGVGAGAETAVGLGGVLFCLLNIFAGLQVSVGVLRPAIDPHLIVQMWASLPAGRPHRCNTLANCNTLPDADTETGEVGVAGLEH